MTAVGVFFFLVGAFEHPNWWVRCGWFFRFFFVWILGNGIWVFMLKLWLVFEQSAIFWCYGGNAATAWNNESWRVAVAETQICFVTKAGREDVGASHLQLVSAWDLSTAAARKASEIEASARKFHAVVEKICSGLDLTSTLRAPRACCIKCTPEANREPRGSGNAAGRPGDDEDWGTTILLHSRNVFGQRWSSKAFMKLTWTSSTYHSTRNMDVMVDMLWWILHIQSLPDSSAFALMVKAWAKMLKFWFIPLHNRVMRQAGHHYATSTSVIFQCASNRTRCPGF